jgi:hypothetical protein
MTRALGRTVQTTSSQILLATWDVGSGARERRKRMTNQIMVAVMPPNSSRQTPKMNLKTGSTASVVVRSAGFTSFPYL